MESAHDRGTQMRKVGEITLCRHDDIKTRVFGAKIRYNIWVGYDFLRILSRNLK